MSGYYQSPPSGAGTPIPGAGRRPRSGGTPIPGAEPYNNYATYPPPSLPNPALSYHTPDPAAILHPQPRQSTQLPLFASFPRSPSPINRSPSSSPSPFGIARQTDPGPSGRPQWYHTPSQVNRDTSGRQIWVDLRQDIRFPWRNSEDALARLLTSPMIDVLLTP